MITYLLQVTLCLGCFYALYHFALRKETLFWTNRVYLLGTLVVSMILPWIKIYIDSRVAASELITAPAVYIGSYLDTLSDAIVITPSTQSFNWTKAVSTLYLAGMGILTIRLLKSVYEISQIRKTSQRVEIEGTICLLSGIVKTPFSFFNEVYLPLDHPFAPHELRKVLSHEAAHIRARHTWDVLLVETACILLWLNPFVYLYRKSLRDVHEYTADAEVIKDTPWEAYAQLLVTQQQHHLQHLLSHQFYSQLKKRLRMMNQQPSAATARLKYLGILPLLLLALLAFSFRERQDLRPEGQRIPQGVKEWDDTNQKFNLYYDGLKIYASLDHANSKSVDDPMLLSELTWQSGQEPVMPVFPGCTSVAKADLATCSSTKMMQFIQQHLQYPETLRKSGLEGKVFVRFVVGSNGLIQKAEVIQSLSPEADQAALGLINGMNEKAGKWQPAMKDGKAIDAELVLPVTFALTEKGKEEPYTYVEEMPRFPGCENMSVEKERFTCVMEKLYEFIGRHLSYPEEDRKNKIEGTGIVQFVVEADGQLSDIQVLRSPSPSMTTEMTRLMGEMATMAEKWIPGKHEGKNVPVKFTLPIKFVLQDKDDPTGQEKESTTGVSEVSIRVQPNPATTSISVNTFAGAHTIQIFDTDGKARLSKKVDPAVLLHTLDISILSPGQYVIKAFSGEASAVLPLSVVR